MIISSSKSSWVKVTPSQSSVFCQMDVSNPLFFVNISNKQHSSEELSGYKTSGQEPPPPTPNVFEDIWDEEYFQFLPILIKSPKGEDDFWLAAETVD